jgi:hypothetical protein
MAANGFRFSVSSNGERRQRCVVRISQVGIGRIKVLLYLGTRVISLSADNCGHDVSVNLVRTRGRQLTFRCPMKQRGNALKCVRGDISVSE